MSKYDQIKGLALLNDLESHPSGYLTGGMNMVKRGKVGMVRRPEYSPLDAVTGPSTSPKGAFPLEYYGQAGDIMALDNGILYKADRSDSYDQVTKGVTNARPTFTHLGEWGFFATGGRVMKYDGSKTPHPLGSKFIADMEPDEAWTDANGYVTDDNANELSGVTCKKVSLDGVATQDETLTLSLKEILFDNGSGGSVGNYSGRITTLTEDCAANIVNDTVDQVTISDCRFRITTVVGSPTGDLTVRAQRTTSEGVPDGTDLTTGTLANASIAAGTHTVTFGATFTVNPGETIAIIYDMPVQAADGRYLIFRNSVDGTGFTRASVDGSGVSGDWSESGLSAYSALMGGSLDLYSGYPDNSTIKLNMFMDVIANFDTGVGSYIKFIVSAGVTEAEYQFVAGDLSTAWKEISLIRGANADDAGKGDSDFTITGTMDWGAVTTVEIMITSQTGNLNVYLDYMFMLHLNAPPSSDKVFVSNESVWVLSGNEARYSQRSVDFWWPDTISVFPSNCISVSQGQGATLIHNEKGTWASPRITSGFPDFDFVQISPFGTTSRHGAVNMKYKNQDGSAWVSPRGLHFWAGGINSDVIVSEDIQPVFDGSGNTDVKSIDWSRGDEIICLFHPRYEELWMFVPHGDDTDGLIYAYVLDAGSGRWNTMFKWFGANPITFASIIRDDGIFKLLVTDTGGGIHAEAEGGTSPETSVLSYGDTWFMGLKDDEETDMHAAVIKYKPRTTSSFAMEVRTRLAKKEDEADSGGEVDYEVCGSEEAQVVYPDAFDPGTGMDRSVTAPDVDSLYVKKVSIDQDNEGHALSLRLGVLSGGTDEWELTGFRLIGSGDGGF